MNEAMLLRRRLMQAFSGDWNPGYAIDTSKVMHFLGGNSDISNSCTASVLTPVFPIFDGELNITLYIANKTPYGVSIDDLRVSGLQPSFHIYKGKGYGDYYRLNPSGDCFNRVITKGSGKSVNEAYDGLKFCVWIFGAEESYAYINETGRVLFAGKNTPYYGKSNIHD